MAATTKKPESTRTIAQALVIQGFSLRVVSEKTGLNPRTVQTWARRYGWRELRDKIKQEVNPATEAEPGAGVVAVSLPRERSELSVHDEKVRIGLAKSLAAQVEVMSQSPPKKVSDLTGREGLAQATKTIADAASTVFGWAEGTIPGLIVYGKVSSCPPADRVAQVTDVRTVPQDVQPARPLGWEYDDPGAAPITSEPAGSR
jgi:hypothetical protein